MEGGDRMLTLTQAAGVAGVHASRLRHLIADGRLTAIKPGHDWLILESELRRWMEQDRDRRFGPHPGRGGRKPRESAGDN